MSVDPLTALVSGSAVVIAAGITGWVASKGSRRQFRTELEKSQALERAEMRNFLWQQLDYQTKERDALRARLDKTEKDLQECIRNHLGDKT
jgi:hypothetical protein